MRKLLVAVATSIAFASPAMASSPYDGVYSCTIFVPAIGQGFSDYVVVMTNAAGITGASSLAPVPNSQQLFGYSFGTITGNTYTGTSGLTGQTTSVQLNGGVTQTHLIVGGVTYAANSTCARIFGP